MRAAGYTVQHTLTTEAAVIVKQALGLCRRRGHAQVTPLHVASAMLTSPRGLLRKACFKINSHPLQCNALELCFNVALNRLSTSQSSSIILRSNLQSHHPSLSNALVAAFKRALAQKRRGSVENHHQQQQQQPVLALKVEIEQLTMSILDDPSVSRVMREAGFSSTQIKNIIEQSVSMEIYPQRPIVVNQNIKPVLQDFHCSNGSKLTPSVRIEDVMRVIDTMLHTKRKNVIVIRECLVSAYDIVAGVIDKFEGGNDVVFPGNLRFVQFVSLPLHSLGHLSMKEVEDKVKDLSFLIRSNVERGVILYVGDLKWVSDYWSKQSEKSLRSYYYSPMEQMIMELSKLVFGYGDSGKLWLMGIANSETYMSCKNGHPSLETLWNLFAHTTPVSGLDLTLNLDHSKDSPNESKRLSFCAHNNESVTTVTTNSSLPLWLQQNKGKNPTQVINNQEHDGVGSLCKQPRFLDKTFRHSSASSTTSYHTWPMIFDSKKIHKERQFFTLEMDSDDVSHEGNLKQLVDVKPDFLSDPSSSPNSASCSDQADECLLNNFKEVNSDNIKILTNVLKKRVPRQQEIIPEIVTTVLRCRSGLTERKGKEETWLFFSGSDSHGKEMISRELATVVFGTKNNNFIRIGFSCFSSVKSNSMDDDDKGLISNKRSRSEHGKSYIERFADAMQENASRVFFMEDVDQVDYRSQMGIMKAMERGRIALTCGKSVHLKDAIVVLACESFTSASRPWFPTRQNHKDGESSMLDLNVDAENFGILNLVDTHVNFKI